MSAIQKRMISKQLLSQVHLCRFLYKLISNIDAGIHYDFSPSIQDELVQFLFYKLHETKNLSLVSRESVEEYREFSDYKKLEKLVDEYILKYKRKLKTDSSISASSHDPAIYTNLISGLTAEIQGLFEVVSQSREPSFLTKEIVVLDYMVTTVQLHKIMKNGDLSDFHFKSKIQAIVDGESIAEVTGEHVIMIGNKLRALGLV